MVRAVRSAAALSLALPTVLWLTASHAPARTPAVACAPGRFLVPAADQPLLTPTGPHADAVLLERERHLVLGDCGGVTATVIARRRATIVRASFPSCLGFTKVRLRARIAAPGCDVLSGRVKARRARPHAFTATRSTCGDGVVDAGGGETCDATAPGGDAACPGACPDAGVDACRCPVVSSTTIVTTSTSLATSTVPPETTTTTESTTSTSTTTSTTSTSETSTTSTVAPSTSTTSTSTTESTTSSSTTTTDTTTTTTTTTLPECTLAADCPAAVFGSPPVCDQPSTNCQGHRVDPVCTGGVCGSRRVADDSACGSGITKLCGFFKPAACTGAATQAALVCPTSCVSDDQCTTGNHCFQGECVPFVQDGGGCSTSLQCLNGHCVGGLCCATACNNTACDTCGGGTCRPFHDPEETGNGCANAVSLGSGQLTTSITSTIENSADVEDWYSFFASDESGNCIPFFVDPGTMTITLTPPAGVDYDLELYRATGSGCGSLQLLGSSHNGVGAVDSITHEEQCGADDSGVYFVRVIRFGGFSCAVPYTLAVRAQL